jgi:hypothetical protein
MEWFAEHSQYSLGRHGMHLRVFWILGPLIHSLSYFHILKNEIL